MNRKYEWTLIIYHKEKKNYLTNEQIININRNKHYYFFRSETTFSDPFDV